MQQPSAGRVPAQRGLEGLPRPPLRKAKGAAAEPGCRAARERAALWAQAGTGRGCQAGESPGGGSNRAAVLN